MTVFIDIVMSMNCAMMLIIRIVLLIIFLRLERSMPVNWNPPAIAGGGMRNSREVAFIKGATGSRRWGSTHINSCEFIFFVLC